MAICVRKMGGTTMHTNGQRVHCRVQRLVNPLSKHFRGMLFNLHFEFVIYSTITLRILDSIYISS